MAVKETPVDGCLITRPSAKTVAGPVTYSEHVAPLMQKHCQECHRTNTAAPFSLMTYKQVAAKADAIAEVITDGRMPTASAIDSARPSDQSPSSAAADGRWLWPQS